VNTVNSPTNLSESHKRWKQLLDVYLTASGVREKSPAQQCATILYCAGSDIILASSHFQWKKDDGSDMSAEDKKKNRKPSENDRKVLQP
jgi:hypothetical protein